MATKVLEATPIIFVSPLSFLFVYFHGEIMVLTNKTVTIGRPPKYGKPSSLDQKLSCKFNNEPLYSDESQSICYQVPSHFRSIGLPLINICDRLIVETTDFNYYNEHKTQGGKTTDGTIITIPNQDMIKKMKNEISASGVSQSMYNRNVIIHNPSTKDQPEFLKNKGCDIDNDAETKKFKRMIANRESAQRSRNKKIEYKANLEKTVTNLEANVKVFASQVAQYDQQRQALKMENIALKQKISSVISDNAIKGVQFQALNEEKEKLWQLYVLQLQHRQQKQQT